MQAWPNLQEVTIQPLAGGSGNKWNVGHKGHSSSDPKDYPHVNLPTDGGPYLIHFVINNPGNSVRFVQNDPSGFSPIQSREPTSSIRRSRPSWCRATGRNYSFSTRTTIILRRKASITS